MAIFNIAAGHGKTDSGAVLGNRLEKDDNLKIALALGAELTKRGHTVRQYRTDDTKNCDWQNCRKWLESNAADFSLVLHRNAFNGSANGVEVWSFDNDSKSTQIAADISTAIARASGMYNRGRKGNGAAWLSSKVLCCEPEVGFLDNASDNEKFDNNFNAIVEAICNVLESHYGTAGEVIGTGTTTNYLNIRTAPKTGDIITSMPTGSKCEIYTIEDGWAYLTYKGIKGYSSTEYMVVEMKEKPVDYATENAKLKKTIADQQKTIDELNNKINAIKELLK